MLIPEKQFDLILIVTSPSSRDNGGDFGSLTEVKYMLERNRKLQYKMQVDSQLMEQLTN